MFQINHARIIEPKVRESHCTKDDRLFPAVRVVDSTGMLELRMREQTALSLAGANDKAEFIELASDGALNFPILTSLRVVLQSTRNEDSASEHADKKFNAIIVEAVEQDILVRKAMPNKSMEYLIQLMHSLPADSTRMLVARRTRRRKRTVFATRPQMPLCRHLDNGASGPNNSASEHANIAQRCFRAHNSVVDVVDGSWI